MYLLLDLPQFQQIVATAALSILAYVTIAYGISWLKRDFSVIDIFWGPGFFVIALVTFLIDRSVGFKQYLIVAMLMLWSFRLALFLVIRNWGQPEDWRYQQMRSNLGDSAKVRAYINIFLLQGALMLFYSVPVMFMSEMDANTLTGFNIIGIVVWLLGLWIESNADVQMYEFKSSNPKKGEVLRSGFWNISRHPNYMGEIILWFGATAFIYEAGFEWIFAFPFILALMIYRVSGVSMQERKIRHYTEYDRYKHEVGAIFPKFSQIRSWGLSLLKR